MYFDVYNRSMKKKLFVAMLGLSLLPFVASAAPAVDLKVNGLDELSGQFSGTSVVVSWTAKPASQCILSVLNSDGTYITKNYFGLMEGDLSNRYTATIPANFPKYAYTLYCVDSKENWTSDQVVVNVFTEVERQQMIRALQTEIDELMRLLKKLEKSNS